MFFIAANLLAEQRYEETKPAAKAIVTPIGVFVPTLGGIQADLSGSFKVFSGHYPWSLVAPCLATFRLIAESEFSSHSFGGVIDRLVERLIAVNVDVDGLADDLLGYDGITGSYLLREAEFLIPACPDEGVKRQMSIALHSPYEVIDRWVGNFVS